MAENAFFGIGKEVIGEVTSLDVIEPVVEEVEPITIQTLQVKKVSAKKLQAVETTALETDSEESEEKKLTTIALIDTGVGEEEYRSDNVIERVSVIGDTVWDDNGHGTSMLGYILEEAPEAKVISIKALNEEGKGTVDSVIAGINYAIEKKVDVINLSFSAYSTENNEPFVEAVLKAVEAGIIVVGAAGNSGADASQFVPAKIPEAVVVGACDSEGNILETSNRGETVDWYVVAGSTSEATARTSGKALTGDGSGVFYSDEEGELIEWNSDDYFWVQDTFTLSNITKISQVNMTSPTTQNNSDVTNGSSHVFVSWGVGATFTIYIGTVTFSTGYGFPISFTWKSTDSGNSTLSFTANNQSKSISFGGAWKWGNTTVTATLQSYRQLRQYRLQKADGNYESYVTIEDKNYTYNSTVAAWSRAQDATYNAASIASYKVTGANTKQVNVTRRTSTNVIRYRFQNADGTYGGYTNAVNASYRVGQTVSWGGRTQDATYNAAGAVSFTATATGQTKSVDITRRTSTNVIRHRFQNADGTWSGYTNDVNASYRVGQTVSWGGRAADATYQKADSVSFTATASAQTKSVDIYRVSYTASFDSQGGSAVNSITKLAGNTLGTLPTPTREGYEFIGWFTAVEGGTQITSDTAISTTTYYAHWKALGRMSIKVNGSWIIGDAYIKVNGQWVRAQRVWIKVNGEWKSGV